MEQAILTLGGNNVAIAVPAKPPKQKIVYTPEEIREMEESWDRCHFQMCLKEDENKKWTPSCN